MKLLSRFNRGGFGWNAAAVGVTRVFMRSAQFIAGVLVARLVGVEGRGLFAALTVPTNLSVMVSELGMRQATAYHIGRKTFSTEDVQATLLAMVPIASLLAIAASLLYFHLTGIAADDWTLRLLTVAVIPFNICASYASGIFLGRKRIAEFRKTAWRPALVNLALIGIVGYGLHTGLVGVMVAAIAAAAASAAYALYLLARELPLRFKFDRQVARRLQRTGITYALSLLILTLNYRIMVVVLTRVSSIGEVGLFAQASSVAELAWEFPTALSTLIFAHGVNATQQEAFSRKVIVLGRISTLASLAVALGLGLVSPWLFPAVYGAGFAGSAPVCVALLPGIVAFTLFKVLNMDMAGRGKPWIALWVMVPVLVLNILLGWYGASHYGALGAAVAATICYVVAVVGMTILYAREVGVSLATVLVPRRSDFQMVIGNLLNRKRAP